METLFLYMLGNALSGLISSWLVGLAPAFLYRYIIYKNPIDSKKVFWLLAPVIIIIMFIYKIIMAGISGGIPNGNPLPWVIIYYVGKWIMTKKDKKTIIKKKEHESVPVKIESDNNYINKTLVSIGDNKKDYYSLNVNYILAGLALLVISIIAIDYYF